MKERFAHEKRANLKRATGANCSGSLLCLEQPERFAHERLSEEQRERVTPWHKKGENRKQKNYKKYNFLKNFSSESLVFERFNLVALLSWVS